MLSCGDLDDTKILIPSRGCQLCHISLARTLLYLLNRDYRYVNAVDVYFDLFGDRIVI